jgi:tRNA pseudouridine65 synthase
MTTIPVVYRDDELIAIDKPPWSVVHPQRGADDALVLIATLAAELGQPVFPVHRLDRQTSGVMVFALSQRAAQLLSSDIREGLWRKTYLALCRGCIRETMTVEHGVKEGETRRPALTTFDPVEHFCGRYTLVRARPMTGRRHQIRYHLKHVGHPLVGDVKYGQGLINRFFRSTFGLGRFFLHAERLTVFRPGLAETLGLSAPLPSDLECVLEQLRAYQGPVV